MCLIYHTVNLLADTLSYLLLMMPTTHFQAHQASQGGSQQDSLLFYGTRFHGDIHIEPRNAIRCRAMFVLKVQTLSRAAHWHWRKHLKKWPNHVVSNQTVPLYWQLSIQFMTAEYDFTTRWPATAQRPARQERKRRSQRAITTARSECLSSTEKTQRLQRLRTLTRGTRQHVCVYACAVCMNGCMYSLCLHLRLLPLHCSSA